MLRTALFRTSTAITAILLLGGLSGATAQSAMASNTPSTTTSEPALAPVSSGSTTMVLGASANLSGANPAGCEVQVDDAHISSTVRPRSVKVNARIKSCKFAVSNLYLKVQLWKTGLFFDHLQAQTVKTSRSGKSLQNQSTFVNCKNTTNSRFYGIAYGQATIGGKVYAAT